MGFKSVPQAGTTRNRGRHSRADPARIAERHFDADVAMGVEKPDYIGLEAIEFTVLVQHLRMHRVERSDPDLGSESLEGKPKLQQIGKLIERARTEQRHPNGLPQRRNGNLGDEARRFSLYAEILSRRHHTSQEGESLRVAALAYHLAHNRNVVHMPMLIFHTNALHCATCAGSGIYA